MRVIQSLKLKGQIVVNYHIAAGNQTQALCESNKCC